MIKTLPTLSPLDAGICYTVARQPPNRRRTNSQNGHSHTPNRPIEILTNRLKDVNLPVKRFVDVQNGSKQCYDHTKTAPEDVRGNYGVYCGGGLIGIDIDDFNADTSKIDSLPSTFRVSTPHSGEHRYFRDGGLAEKSLLAVTGGSSAPSLSWGELYTSKYLVGPGSEIVSCSKRRCYSCERESPGRYTILEDRPIASISAEEIIAIVHHESDDQANEPRQKSLCEFATNNSIHLGINRPSPTTNKPSTASTIQTRLNTIFHGDSDEEKVWAILTDEVNSNPKDRANIGEVIDRAESLGVGEPRTADLLMAWRESGALRPADETNWIVPIVKEGGP